MRSVLIAVVVLCVCLSVPLTNEWTLSRARRERVAAESQLLSLRRQIESARVALDELSRLRERAPETAERIARVENALGSVNGQLNAVEARVEKSLGALSADQRDSREGLARDTFKALEDLRSHISVAESRLRDELKRAEGPESRSREWRDLDAMRTSMLAPTVQLSGEDTVGSGVILSSKPEGEGRVATFVVSSYHVVRNILAEAGDPKGAKGVAINTYPEGVAIAETADVVAIDEPTDLVLLRLRGNRLYTSVARVMPPARLAGITVFTPIYAVGCPLGNDPIPTAGEIASTRNVVSSHNYWMLNAPTYFGNSGGGVFLGRTQELIGIFSKIYTHGHGHPTVIPHMGLATPIDAVVTFLEKHGYGHLAAAPVAAEAPADAAASRPALSAAGGR